MDLITIHRNPIEVVHSKRKIKHVTLDTTTLPALNERIGKLVQELADEGFPLHRLAFECGQTDDGDGYVTCRVTGSRMETPEETAKRIASAEAYNARQITEHKQKVEASKRSKELARVAGHLTLEQLQALQPLTPKEQPCS
jgi:hypothetical protein